MDHGTEDNQFDRQLREAIHAEPLDTTALDARIVAQLNRSQNTSHVHRGKWVAAVSIAALLLLAIGGYFLAPNRGNAAMCADAARDHRIEVVEHSQRRWLTDVAAIESLAAKQGFSARSTDTIAPPGYHVARAKLCRLGGRVFLHLVYSDGAHEYSFYLRDSAAQDLAAVRDLDAEHVAPVLSRRYTALVVTDESRSAAIEIARLTATRL
jgi:hypothetical protein